MICFFLVLDLLLVYVFFVSVPIPMFIIIGVWGSNVQICACPYCRLALRARQSVPLQRRPGLLLFMEWLLTALYVHPHVAG